MNTGINRFNPQIICYTGSEVRTAAREAERSESAAAGRPFELFEGHVASSRPFRDRNSSVSKVINTLKAMPKSIFSGFHGFSVELLEPEELMEYSVELVWEVVTRKVQKPVPVSLNWLVMNLLHLYWALIQAEMPLDPSSKDLGTKEKEGRLEAPKAYIGDDRCILYT